MSVDPAAMGRHPPSSAGIALNTATARLAAAGVMTPRLDARVLLAHVLDRDQAWLAGHPEALLSDAQWRRFDALVARRESREPVAYLTGQREFWSRPFQVTRDTLIPRPDTETVISVALELVAGRDRPLRILDLGTGGGCLLVTLLHAFPKSEGLGIDISEAALAVAAKNAARHDVAGRATFERSDWLDNHDVNSDRYDLVVSNPPYVSAAEMAALEPDIADFEPSRALAAGADGLDAYRRIAPGVTPRLAPGGVFIGEFGVGQERRVSDILAEAGLEVMAVHADLTGRPRSISAGITRFYRY